MFRFLLQYVHLLIYLICQNEFPNLGDFFLSFFFEGGGGSKKKLRVQNLMIVIKKERKNSIIVKCYCCSCFFICFVESLKCFTLIMLSIHSLMHLLSSDIYCFVLFLIFFLNVNQNEKYTDTNTCHVSHCRII